MPPRAKKRKKNPKRNPDYIDWRNSAAKKAIFFDIQDGVIDPVTTSAEDAWEVYQNRDEFEGVCWKQFSTNYKNHCKSFTKKRERSIRDQRLLEEDRILFPCDETHDDVGRLMFSRHAAMALLRIDIKAGLYPLFTPSELWSHPRRPEYREFELSVFTQRIYQEIRRNKFINYLNDKREDVEHAEHRRQRDYTFD